MKKDFTLLTIFLLFYGTGSAQTTLTSANIPTPGTTASGSYTDAPTGTLPGSAGANQNWNFANPGPGTFGTSTWDDPATAPGSNHFPSATVALDYGIGATYYRNNAGDYELLGTYNSPNDLAIIYNDPIVLMRYPMSFNDTYTDDFGYVNVLVDDPDRNYTRYLNGTISGNADAYGTLTTPEGTFGKVLRVHIHETSVDSAVNIIFSINDTSITVIYQTRDTWSYYQEGVVPAVFYYTEIYTEVKGGNITTSSLAGWSPDGFQVPEADFSASVNDIEAGNTVNFSDASQHDITSWLWTFEGGTPATSTEQHPSGILYTLPGDFQVSLTVTGGGGSDEKTETGYIKVQQGVGVEEQEYGGSPEIFPSIGSGIFRIQTDVPVTRYRVFNSAGCLIRQSTGVGFASQYSSIQQFDLRGLSDGVYFVHLFSGEELWVRKLSLVN